MRNVGEEGAGVGGGLDLRTLHNLFRQILLAVLNFTPLFFLPIILIVVEPAQVGSRPEEVSGAPELPSRSPLLSFLQHRVPSTAIPVTAPRTPVPAIRRVGA